MKLKELKLHERNPRRIEPEKLDKLAKSLKDFPKMMELRPIVIDSDNVILGGNMRFRALKKLGYKEVPDEWIKRADELTEEQKREFIIKDNVGFGEWENDILAEDYTAGELSEWGLDLNFGVDELSEQETEEDNPYTEKVQSPIYEVKEECKDIKELYDVERVNNLLKIIEDSDFSNMEKDFLRFAAYRFCNINFTKCANYYAGASKEMQEVFEKLALVIVDYDTAIENGFVKLSNQILEEYGDE